MDLASNENFSKDAPRNFAKNSRNETVIKRIKIIPAGADSKTERAKLCQYFNTIPGSENISETKGPKSDSASTCLKPINAKTERIRKTTKKEAKKARCFFTKRSCFSSFRRFMMREKRPRGGVAGEIRVNIRLSSRIDSNTS